MGIDTRPVRKLCLCHSRRNVASEESIDLKCIYFRENQDIMNKRTCNAEVDNKASRKGWRYFLSQGIPVNTADLRLEKSQLDCDLHGVRKGAF